MATIVCYSELNFGGAENAYSKSNPDITANGAVLSAKVSVASVTVHQDTQYQGESALLLPGDYADNSKFPQGVIKSLKI